LCNLLATMARLTCFALCALVALMAAPARCQPPGSNPGLPPSATATGLAAQKITDMAGEVRSRICGEAPQDRLGFCSDVIANAGS
jgi:hypothetical protein